MLIPTDDSLKSVNLFHGGVGNKQVRMYSGGMKQRLSVAISLIGDPKVLIIHVFIPFAKQNIMDPATKTYIYMFN
jgi:ABC-type polysaccharide/polyol phosphate transport system ATPase subunit